MFDARSFRFPLFVHFSLLGFSGESFRSRFISTLISTKRMRCVVHHKETDLRGDGALLFGIGMRRRNLYLGAIGITVLHSFLSRADELIDS
jgi:hypothetical protein